MSDNKYMWIHLRKDVEADEWMQSHDSSYETSITYEPELKNKKNYMGGDTSHCIYFHRKVIFDVSLSLPQDSTSMNLLINYRAQTGGEEQEELIEAYNREEADGKPKYFHYCDPEEGWYREDVDDPCREYFWAFDPCVVKIYFLNEEKKSVFTKRVNLGCFDGDSKGDPCFVDSSFVSVDKLKELLNCEVGQDSSFLPISIEIAARLHLDAVDYMGERFFEEGDKYRVITRPTFQNAASNKRMKLSSIVGVNDSDANLSPDTPDCDVVIKIGGYEIQGSISVHKSVLAVKSPVFRSMFGSKWDAQSVRVQDYSVASVKAFIKYLYDSCTNSIDLEGLQSSFEGRINFCLEVLKLAHFYQVLALVECCADSIFIASNADFTMTDALDVFNAGELFNIEDLTARALQWIKNAKKGKLNEHDQEALELFIDGADEKTRGLLK